MADDFETALRDGRTMAASGSRAADARRVLEEFCEGVVESTDNQVRCRLVPGFSVNLGQEWRVVVQAAEGPEQILLRAYIDPRGFPVHLDVYDEELVESGDEGQLRTALLQFSRRETTAVTLLGLAPQE